MAAETFANPNKEILTDNFRFTKAEDILFPLEVDGNHVYDLLYKRIYKRPYAKANESTAILEAAVTAILRCFGKSEIEVKSDWSVALREALPESLDEYKRLLQTNCSFTRTVIRQA